MAHVLPDPWDFPSPPRRDVALAALAERQGGAVSLAQLYGLGFSRGAVDHAVVAGRLHRRHRGVYAVGHPALTPRGRLWAALLACGPGAVLSHRSAAHEHGIRPTSRPGIDVTAPTRRRGGSGLQVHVSVLDPRDVGSSDGLPVTTVPRTLLDLADVLSADQLVCAVREAEFRRLLDMEQLRDVLARSNGRHGAGRLRAALDLDAPATESPLEEEFLAFLRRRALPLPQTQARIGRHRADALWPDHRLVAELDGFAAHSTRRAFRADRRRDADHQLAGLRVIRITAYDVRYDAGWLERTLRALLAAAAPAIPSASTGPAPEPM